MSLLKKLAIAAVAGSMILSGCSDGEVVDEKKETSIFQKKEKVSKVNLLTGLEDMSEKGAGKRPVAIMVNNVEPAMPQYGVEAADVIFEIPVEGDLTRFMAMYADYTKVPEICPIRSCRYYFPVMSEGFDAFYVHWGMDPSIEDHINGMNLDRFDGMANPYDLFGRDQGRLDEGYSLEHTATFDGPKFTQILEKEDYRLELNEGYKDSAFKFNKKVKPAGEDACTQVDLDFGAQGSTFTYDAENDVYLKQINGMNQIDAKTQNQLGFTNLVVLETSIEVRPDGNHKKIDIFGNDESVGYYISNGTMKKIHWKKDGVKGRLKFFDEEGKEVKLNKGKTYIAFNYPGQSTFA